MTISMYSASVPVLTHALNNLKNVLTKGQEHAKAKGTDEANYLDLRLAPDMFTLARQVRIACDVAKRGMARLAGTEAPTHADDETNFAALIARCESVIEYLGTFKPEQIDGTEEKPITIQSPFGDLHFQGQNYLFGFMIANVHFHSSMTYALLRNAGVEVGKRDYLGG